MKAIILAGGKSSRMGQDKASMILGGKTMIQHVIDKLSFVFDEIFISGNHSNYPNSKGIIKDVTTQKGPIGGICSALEFCQEDIFVCSCDMPFVSSDLIKKILQKKIENRINVVRFGEKIYPVLGIYPFSILNDLMKTIESGNLRMTSFLEQQNAHYIIFDEGFEHQFLNINTPENFKTAEKIIKYKMKLKIFGKLTDIFHGNKYDLDSENEKSVSELKVNLYEKFPELKESTFLIIVSGVKANDDEMIPENAEIALLPPYSGG